MSPLLEAAAATLEDEQAAHQDTLRLLAAKDREIAELKLAYDAQHGELYDAQAQIAALKAENAQLWLAVDPSDIAALSASPAPDPAEAMRAKCEKLARGYAEDIPTTQIGDGMRFAAHAIAGLVAALKGKGEGTD